MPPETVLILGGTAEARALADRLSRRAGIRLITSLAGRTAAPARHAGEVRTGGFGGARGLARYIADEKVTLVVDATHPFAAAISANAAAACGTAHVPCLRLERPPWRPLPEDDWREVADIGKAATAIPAGSRALVTVGRQEIAPFLAREDVTLIARMIEPPDVAVPPHAELVLARPPFGLDDERRLLRDKAIDTLVAKNSGGTATVAKLMAARELRVPVIMVRRPAKPPVPTAPDLEAMLEMIARALG